MFDIYLSIVAHLSLHIKLIITIHSRGFLTLNWGYVCNKELSYGLQRVTWAKHVGWARLSPREFQLSEVL